MNNLKKLFLSLSVFLFVVIFSVISLFFLKDKPRKENLPVLEVGKNKFEIEIADDAVEQARGLSGRDSLEEKSGMLFVFNGAGNQKFWMAGMKFPLDMLWISGDKIIGISENLPPATATNVPIYSSPGPTDKVLEINAGLSEKFGIKIGDTIVLK